MKPLRIIIADDHPLTRAGLRDLLDGESGMHVIGEADSYPALWDALVRDEPDLVLLDLRMPGGSGVDAVRRLRQRHPRVRVIVLSGYPEDAFLIRTIRAGAAGYVQKDRAPEEVIRAVRIVAAGEVYVSETGGRALARAARPGGPASDLSSLSDREFEVLRLLGTGLAIGEIADRLHLSAKTVSTYRARLMQKMGFSSTADIIRFAIENGVAE